MKTVWSVLALILAIGAAWLSPQARAEVEDVDCGALDRIGIPEMDRFDEVHCMAGRSGGLSSGESRRPVGGDVEMIIAYNRATLVAVRFIATNFRTFMELPSVPEYVGDVFAGWEPRNWSDERQRDRFAIADMEVRVIDDAPFLPCVGFLVRMRPIGQAPGYREALSGMYCGMDTLTPTEGEVTAFLNGLRF